MRIMLLDDELPALDELSYLLGKYTDLEVVAACTDPRQVLEAVESSRPDVIFMDIDMPHMDGLELALQMQALYSNIIVVFVTAYTKYALDSFKVYPLDYLLKPIKEARLDAAIERLRSQYVLMHPDPDNKAVLRIKCFGQFEVLGADEIKWGTRRVKELFLYLLDRCGAPVTRNELIQAIFGGVNDKKSANNMYVTIYKLRSLLDSIDPGGKMIKLKEDYSLQVEPGVCDYIDFISFARQNLAISRQNAVQAARVLSLNTGHYLQDFDWSWALDTASVTEAEYERIALGLASYHSGAGRLREAENILLKLLMKNSLSEAGYIALLDIYMTNANHRAYLARYVEYARILDQELGEKPSLAHTGHYNSIKNMPLPSDGKK